jgi:hypothetical protein
VRLAMTILAAAWAGYLAMLLVAAVHDLRRR